MTSKNSIQRLLRYPKNRSFFLFGPRGTGKSSWVKTEFPDSLYFDLLDSEIYQELLASPKRLSSRIPDPAPEWIIIDEIQKIPALLDEVHRLIETRNLKFILTGSSARKLKKMEANLLAGRAFKLEMSPLHSSELKEKFDIARALERGMLPSAYLNDDFKAYLKAYIGTFLKEEIQQEALVRNLGDFSRFLETASFSQGALLNISKVAAESHIGRKAAEGYFQILEDFLLSKRLPVFTKRAKRKMIVHEKFYFFDVGVFRSLRPKGPLDSPEEMNGAALETLVLQELNGLKQLQEIEFELFFWKPDRGVEVDFVIYGESTFTAIEVKASHRIRSEDLNGLKTFHEDYPRAKRILVYLGDRAYSQDGIKILPATEFFSHLDECLSST